MGQLSKTECGFTLVEVLVSVGILVLFIPFAANMLSNSQLLASFAKHKIQAAYAAQQIIETQRQTPFRVIAAGQSVVIGPSNVILDTKGNYNNVNCNSSNTFCGMSVVTVTPSVYTSTSGAAQPASSTIDHIAVKIYWNENILNLRVPITEYYSEDIVNDPMLN